MTQRPLLLKDYLEQDPFSDSSNGVLSFPGNQECSLRTVRYLLEAELSVGARLVRSRSKNALNKLPLLIKAVKSFPISSPNIAKKFSGRFWSKKKKVEGKYKVVTVKDIVRLDSFERTSLCVSSYSSCSEEGSESFLSSSTSGSLEGFGDGIRRVSPVEKSRNHLRASTEKEEDENQGIEGEPCRSNEKKEQLSPISIMDFPDNEGGEEEDEEITSLYFEQSLANIERTMHQMLRKIRRFENLAELHSLDLEIHLSSDDEDDDECQVASSDEITAWDLIRRLRSQYHLDPSSQKLLLDFLMESASLSVGDVECLVITACNWIDGSGFLKKEEHGEDQLNEMERIGRWRFFEGGKDDVVADVEVGVLESLIHELLIDLETV